MLSAFYWGYAMTQVAGGYLSDRIGGDRVMTGAVVAWSLLTFWTPWFIYLYPDNNTLLALVVVSRVVMGCLQGSQIYDFNIRNIFVIGDQLKHFVLAVAVVRWFSNLNPLTSLTGVHFPAISSILGRNTPRSDRAFCFATSCSGSHLG